MVTEAKLLLPTLNQQMKKADAQVKFTTRLQFCDRTVQLAEKLLKYEKLGISVIKPPPSLIIKTYTENKTSIIKEGLREEARQAVEKSKLAKTVNGKITAISKVILQINEYRKDMPYDKDLELLETGLRKSLQEIQFNSYLEEAKISEFKGNTKKALDRYYEALYFLQHDEIDDKFQSEAMNMIEEKIKLLSNP